MRLPALLLAAGLLVAAVNLPAALADPLSVEWITRYCNEEIQTANLAENPRMLRNISNSLMTEAPDYLDGALYLQRRNNFVDLCPELDGIGELSQEWLRPGRVSLSKPAVVIVAVREEFYPSAGVLLYQRGWTPLFDSIKLDYVEDPAYLTLYAGLVPAGPVELSGAIVDSLRNTAAGNTSLHHYFFFQELDAFSPEVIDNLQQVPEPSTAALASCGALGIVLGALRQRHQAARRRPAGLGADVLAC